MKTLSKELILSHEWMPAKILSFSCRGERGYRLFNVCSCEILVIGVEVLMKKDGVMECRKCYDPEWRELRYIKLRSMDDLQDQLISLADHCD
jgi:hypothetical protein